MVTWLRHLMRRNLLLGISLATPYLVIRHFGPRKLAVFGGAVLGLSVVRLAAAHVPTPQKTTVSSSYLLTDLGALPTGTGSAGLPILTMWTRSVG